jgi:hypothetical protein
MIRLHWGAAWWVEVRRAEVRDAHPIDLDHDPTVNGPLSARQSCGALVSFLISHCGNNILK